MEEAVKKAGQEWNSTYADKLEKLLAKRAITVNLGFSTKNLNNLDDVKRRLAELKIEPLTPENKTAIKDLVRELKELAKVMEKVQKYSNIQTPELQQALANKANAEATHMAEKYRQANERVEIAKRRVTLAEQKYADSVFQSSKATQSQTRTYQEQTTYLNRLLKRMATYWSVQQVQTFITSVREVTAQFELQRVSLGAIIQDQARANQLFSEIKAFALKSPVSIMDLTKYTKQLAAYKIETDELFETTKKLTDVSVGLGVSMDRVVLAYGQTRATGYLRASEIRQFTEMGVPIVEELAAKLSKMNSELVTAAQVMDMVSKRGISFDLVKEVFDDMTSAGGMFYQMQEKQGNTLYGLWAKLGDAASVMYDQIGNTSWVNSGMKEGIKMLTDLMRNWEAMAQTAAVTAIPSAIAFFIKYALSSKRKQAADTVAAATAKAREVAQVRLNEATKSGTKADIAAANAALKKATNDEVAARKAATKGSLIASGFKSIAASLATGLGIGAVIGLITSLTYDIFKAWNEARKLKKELKVISTENEVQQVQQVRLFEFLADKARNVALSDRERNDALQELHRTFKDTIPIERMSIENLERMAAGAANATHRYSELTDAIKEHIAEQNRQKALSAIQAELQPKINKELDDMRNILEDEGYGYAEQARFVSAMTSIFSDPDKIQRPLYDNIMEALQNAGIDGGRELARRLISGSDWDRFVRVANIIGVGWQRVLGLDPDKYAWISNLPLGIMNWTADTEMHAANYAETMSQINALTEEQNRNYRAMATNLSRYAETWERVQENIAGDMKYDVFGGNPFKVLQENKNTKIKAYIRTLQDEMGEYWDDSFASLEDTVGESGEKMSQIFFDKFYTPETLSSLPVDLQGYVRTVREAYFELEPEDNIINAINRKFTSIALRAETNMGKMASYLLKDGDKIEDKLKSFIAMLEDVNGRIYQYEQLNNKVRNGELEHSAFVSEDRIEELKKESQALGSFIELLQDLIAHRTNNNGAQADSRLGILQEMANTLKQVNKEYDELGNKIGSANALATTQAKYVNTFKYLQTLANKYNFDLPDISVPTDSASLNRYMGAIKEAMKKLPKSEKAILALEADIADINITEVQKRIEKQLKALADRISRTKTAKEFYEKILNTTGDYSLASKVAESIFGQNGSELRKALAEQVRSMAGDIPLPDNIISADNVIDYKALRQFAEANKNELGKMYDELIKISNDGQKDLAKTYEGYLKDLEKAKSYSDKRIELARYTANQIAEINASALPEDEKQRLTAGYREREDKEAAKLQYEAFKNSALYVQMFEDLDHASTSALTRMRDRLIDLKSQWKNLSPTELKELQSRLNELDTQIAARNPFKALGDAYKKWRDLIKSGRTKEGDEANADAAEKARQEAEKKMLADEKAYEAVAASLGANSVLAKVYRSIADKSKEAYDNAEKTANETAEMVTDWGDISELIANANQKIDEYQQQINEALDGVRKMMVAFGAGDEDLQFFDDVVSSLNEIVDAGQDAATAVGAAMTGDYFTAATKGISAIGGLISGFSNLFHAGKVKRANKEIERQQELLDQLEYTYGRLEKAADKAFGADFVANQKQQQKILLAQQQAYMKQYEAEMSKGKKADKEKAQEFLDKARDVGDQVADMQGKIAERMLGTDLTSAARDFANAWLEAYKEFGNTADAMSEKFHEMIQNMIVESLLAKVMERALKPAFDMIDNMNEEDFYSESFWKKVMATAEQGAKDADHGAGVVMKWIEQMGYDMRELGSEYSGIAKEVSSASSEEINQLSAFVNTALYYVSPIPTISENVSLIRQLMERGTTSTLPDTTAAGWTDWQQQAMDNYKAIAANTAATVVECRRAANACEAATEKLNRIIVAKGGKFAVNTTYV